MSFINKNFGDKPSFLKPIIVVAAVLLIVGGAYSFLGNKNSDSKPTEEAAKQAEAAEEINPSGIDKDKKVANVEDVEAVVAKWIAANPKAIVMSVTKLQKQAGEEQMKDAQKNIANKQEELYNDKSSPQYAPAGYDVTIVEFFDYACGYCKKAQATVEELLKEDKKVRIVYKEFPILGVPSTEMAVIALAVNSVDPSSYRKFHEALMHSNERGHEAAMKAAKTAGVNMTKLEEAIRNDKEKLGLALQNNLVLGGSIGINGTPGFIIGDELVPGALELGSLKEKIAALRAKK